MLIRFLYLLIASLLILSFTVIPGGYAFFTSTKNTIPLQTVWFDPWDINVYVAAIKSGQERGLLLPNLYSSVPNHPVLLYPVYTILGIIFNNANPYYIYFLFSLVISIILFCAIFKIQSLFFNNFYDQLICAVAICIGGGLGFLFFPLAADVTVTSFTLKSAFERPHEALAIIFYLLALYTFNIAVLNQKLLVKKLILSSVCLFFCSLIYPYLFLSFFLISVIFLLTTNKKNIFSGITKLLIATIPSVFLIGFIFQQYKGKNTLSGLLNQSLPSLDPISTILGYGFLLPLFLYQLFLILNKSTKTLFLKNQNILLLNIWIIVSFVLTLLPFGFSRSYFRALFIPLTIISFLTLKFIVQKFKFNYRLTAIVFLAILSLSNIFLTFKIIESIKEKDAFVYITKNESQAFSFLQTLPKDKVVLTSYRFGNLTPALSGQPVFLGHSIMTPDFLEKQNEANQFFSGSLSGDQAENFLRNNNIAYIVFDGDIYSFITQTNPKMLAPDKVYPFIKRIYANPGINIFKFTEQN